MKKITLFFNLWANYFTKNWEKCIKFPVFYYYVFYLHWYSECDQPFLCLILSPSVKNTAKQKDFFKNAYNNVNSLL